MEDNVENYQVQIRWGMNYRDNSRVNGGGGAKFIENNSLEL